MKKVSTVVSFTLLFILQSSLFHPVSAEGSIGIEVGPSLVSIHGEKGIGDLYDPDLGFSGGVIYHYRNQKKFMLSAGLSYERKGAKADIDITDESGNSKGSGTFYLQFDYYQLEVTSSYILSKEKYSIYFGGGGFLGLPVSARAIVKSEILSEPIDQEISDVYNGMDAGFTVHAGYIRNLGTRLALSTQLTYDYGLTQIRNEDFLGYDIRTNSFKLLLGLAWKMAKK